MQARSASEEKLFAELGTPKRHLNVHGNRYFLSKRLPEGLPVRRISIGFAIFLAAFMLGAAADSVRAADPVPDSAAAKLTREKKLKLKVTLDCENMFLAEIMDEMKGSVKDAKLGTLRFKWDPMGVSAKTTRMTIKCKDMPLEDALDKLLTDSGRPWGYYVMVSTKKDDQDDGAIFIGTDATCRGYPPGDPRNKKAPEPKKGK
jgi:hypothetical protein